MPFMNMDRIPEVAAAIIGTGYVAVTAFFVLSGFVLAYNYDLGSRWSRESLLRFGVARLSRIYPAYFLGFLMMIPLIGYRLWAHEPERTGEEVYNGLLNVLLIQAWDPNAAMSWNFPGWSLSNEAFFYVCFPFAGVLLWKISGRYSLVAAGIGIWALSLAAPLWAVYNLPGFGNLPGTVTHLDAAVRFEAHIIKYNPLMRLSEFCAGILLAHVYGRYGWRFAGQGSWFYMPALIVSFGVLSLAGNVPHVLLHNGLLLPLYACLIFGLALGGGFVARFLSTRSAVLLGGASYAMYILHAPLLSWLAVAWKRVVVQPVFGPEWVITYITAVILISCVVFQYLEEPAHRWLKSQLSPAARNRMVAKACPAEPEGTSTVTDRGAAGIRT
jgi:peptidoglycan/LPS O-acetylase OafA/YrhL